MTSPIDSPATLKSPPMFSPPMSSPPLVPRKDPSRPPHAPYRFSSLLNLPRRLVRRNATFKDNESSVGMGTPSSNGSPNEAKRFGDATAGVVRGPRIKLRDVTLEDMYHRLYTPPVTLKDFEDYLAFKERSAENLYFDVWMRNYTAAFEKYFASSPSNQVTPERLISLYETGRLTFLNPDSSLELNVKSELRKAFDDAAARLTATPSSLPVLPPSAFAAIHSEVEASLHRSLSAFLRFTSGNADTNRGWFAKIVGLVTFFLACVPTIVACTLDKSRGWRALGIPLWILGAVVFMGGYRRTCLIIFLFGDRRQLYPWELIRPSLEEVTPPTPPPRPHRPRTVSADTKSAFDATGSFSSDGRSDAKFDYYSSPDPSVKVHSRTRTMSTTNTFDFSELGLAHVPSILLSPSSSSIASRNRDTLYFAPEHLASTLKRSSPTFASLTKIFEPLVIESQREIVFAGAAYSILATLLMCAICFSVPNRRH